MDKNNLIIYVSSRNNYDMLENEVLKINFEGFEFINVDDKSSTDEIEKGKRICKANGVVFLENKSRGVQMATQTLIDFINEKRPYCKWIICFQHDIKPITKKFFSRISKIIKDGKIDDFGAIGFNVLDNGKYTGNSLSVFEKGEQPAGMLGLCHLSKLAPSQRWISVKHNPKLLKKYENIKEPFLIDFPMWAAIGINVKIWNNVIVATTDYHFHLWFPDIAMQLNKNNKPLVVFPRLYCFNQQHIKEKYGIPNNSAHSAKKGNDYHFGEWGPHFENFKKRWGWDYENVEKTFPLDKYKNTLIEELFKHDPYSGPLKIYKIEY